MLYTTNVSVGQNLDALYNAAVSGTAGNPITFLADGHVQLGAPAANATVVGQANGIECLKWYADRATSGFIIVADGRGGNTHDTKSDPSVFNTAADRRDRLR